VTVKLLQLNIFQGKFIPRIIEFVKNNDIDILHFQEVTGGRMSMGGVNNYYHEDVSKTTHVEQASIGIDCFKVLKEELSFEGKLAVTMGLIGYPDAYFGNATLYKPNINLLDQKEIMMKPVRDFDPDFNRWEKTGKITLFSKFEIENKSFWSVNAHLVWGVDSLDRPYKIEQAEIVLQALKELQEPFVFTGDFNVEPATQTASMFDEVAKNWIKAANIKNTLNGKVHPVQKTFSSRTCSGLYFHLTRNKYKIISAGR